MRSHRKRMLAGELYDPLDPGLVAGRPRARDLCQALNATRESDDQTRRAILTELFGRGGDSVWMQPPFFCDYGVTSSSVNASSSTSTASSSTSAQCDSRRRANRIARRHRRRQRGDARCARGGAGGRQPMSSDQKDCGVARRVSPRRRLSTASPR